MEVNECCDNPFLHSVISFQTMGLLPDTQNCRLRMRRECQERFSPPPISKETAS